MATMPWLCALALLGHVCWGFLKPSAQASPKPGRDRAALLSTWQAVALQDYLLPRLPPHPQLEESPHFPLSAPQHCHPAAGCDKGWGGTDTSTTPGLLFVP